MTLKIPMFNSLDNAPYKKQGDSQPIWEKRFPAPSRMIKTRFETEAAFGYKKAIRNLFGYAALKTMRSPDGTNFRAYSTTCHRSL